MNLDSTSNLQAAVQSAEGHHRRLCEAFDRGENVTVALSLAHEKLVRVKALLADATHRHCTCAYCLCKTDNRTGRCTDLTKSPRGWLRCQLSAGHEADPLSLHQIDPAGPVACETCITAD